MTVIDEDGRELTWVARYWRYGVDREQECESLESAVSFLIWGEENGDLSMTEVVDPDGVVAMTKEQLDRIDWDDVTSGRVEITKLIEAAREGS